MDDTEHRLNDIERRLHAIEEKLQIKAVSSQPFADRIVSPKKTIVTAASAETERSGNWLGLIAVICFILAAAFIIKLSIDSGWLTPARQIGVAYLLGLILIGAGFFLLKKDEHYASFLPATGIIILYLATYAAHQYYFLISFFAAIGLTTLVSALCVWLYCKIKHDIYAIIAALGTYLAPILLDYRAIVQYPYLLPISETTNFTLYFFIIISLAFATISIWVKSRTLTVLAAYLAILVNSYVGLQGGRDALIAVILPIHFIIFSVGTYIFSKKTGRLLTERESWSFFPVLLLFYALEYYFLDRVYPDLAPWLSLLFAAFLLSLYWFATRWFRDQTIPSEPMIIAFVTLVVFHAFYLELLPNDVRPWLFIIIFLTLAMLPANLHNTGTYKRFNIPLLAIILILLIEYVNMVFDLMNLKPRFPLTLIALFSFASIWVFILQKGKYLKSNVELTYATLGAAHLLVITWLYHMTVDINSLAVSISWLLYAILVMTLAFARKDQLMARSAIFVLSLAAAKALLYDASAAPTIIRIVCLLLTGIVLYAAGFLFRKINDWPR